jgi:hypothetical protein
MADIVVSNSRKRYLADMELSSLDEVKEEL